MAAITKSLAMPIIVRGDFDGFIGFFIDNLVNLLIITGLCRGLGFPDALVFGTILPGTAVSVLAGNVFYSWQAHRLARREGRSDVTALPYGINTVSLFAFFTLIIAPVYAQTKNAEFAWKIGVVSCFISGIFEGLGAFVGEKIRSLTPRAALLSTLAGIAVTFIALDQTVRMWDRPLVAFIPLALVMAEYFSRDKLPFRIPAGLYAIIIGSIIAWTMGVMDTKNYIAALERVSVYLPRPVFDIFEGTSFTDIVPYLSISIPMGIMSFFGTLQNLESASAAGDRYPAFPSLAMNGVGTIIGAMFGSPFPTTVYIGHPGWKALGARSGYSIINGTVVTIICFTGLMGLIVATVPLEAGFPILLWIGIVITAQAFQTTPPHHAPAVALGLIPAIAAWGMNLLRQYLATTGSFTPGQIHDMIVKTIPHAHGLIAFSEGTLFSAMFLSAIGVSLIEKKYLSAAIWTAPCILFSLFGLIHTASLGWYPTSPLTVGYSLMAITFLLLYVAHRIRVKRTSGQC